MFVLRWSFVVFLFFVKYIYYMQMFVYVIHGSFHEIELLVLGGKE